MDLVYILKKSDINEDLRYSLRSVEKFVPHDKIWVVGYKPSWVTNVEYLPVEQTKDKWKNSVNNIIQACKCPDISEDFVLMNDDFFAIKPIKNLKESINICLGNIESEIKKYGNIKVKSSWMKAFPYIVNLLKSLKIKEPYYNYETHTPLLINKQKYLEVMNLSKVQEFMKTSKVLHKRSLYKNIEKPENQRIINVDVKVDEFKDDSIKRIKICDWLSVFDSQVGNLYFEDLNNLLQNLFPDQCKYEIPQKDYKIKTFYKEPIKPVKKPKNFYTF